MKLFQITKKLINTEIETTKHTLKKNKKYFLAVNIINCSV